MNFIWTMTRVNFSLIYFRNLAFIILALNISACVGGGKSVSEELKERELLRNNHIRKVTEYNTKILLGMKQQEMIVQVNTIDEQGRLVMEQKFKSDSVLDCTILHTYNSAGDPDSTVASNADGSLLYKVKVNYDEKGRRKDFYFYLPDGTYKYRNVSAYNSSGQLSELSWYWPDGFKAKNVYEYASDLKISDTEIGPKGETRYTWKYAYDSKRHLISAEQIYPDQKINASASYVYDQNGRVLEENHTSNSAFQSKFMFSYDEAGLLLKREEYSASGKILAVSRFVYEVKL